MVTHRLADGGVIVRDRVPSSDVVRGRFAEIDGLKAVAIAAIVAYQTQRFVGLPTGTPAAVLRLCDDASQGFALFLVVSAFALAYPVFATLGSDGAAYLDVGRYAVKRFVRVYPACAIVLAIAAALHPLAGVFGLSSVASATPIFDAGSFARAAVFANDAGNDGLAAVSLVARAYVVFPFLLALWARVPAGAIALAIVAALLDLFTAARGWGVGIVVPFVLGIAAADVRAGRPRLERFGFPLALAGAAVAWLLETHLALPGVSTAPATPRIDPFWSLAAVGLLAGIGAAPPIERLANLAPVRLLGAASYAVSLVAMPVAAFAARHVTPRLGWPGVAIASAGAVLAVGFVLWQSVDRWFADDSVRRRVADRIGPAVAAVLARVRADRVVLGGPTLTHPGDLHVVAVSPENFYAPPARPSESEVATLSSRSGSADELAAEILEAKHRLGERSTTLLAPEPISLAGVDEAPGLHRRQATPPPNARRAVHLRISPERERDDT